MNLATLRSKTIAWGLFALSGVSRLRLAAYPDLQALLDEIGTDGGRAAVSVADCVALYEIVRAARPRHLLELGAGRSSAVIALAMPSDAMFVAVEENPRWLDNHRRIIPARLHNRIQLIQRNAGARSISGIRCAHYLDLPQQHYEFVHIDGPCTGSKGARVSCDILDLLPILADDCTIVFDGREETARAARPALEAAGFRMRRHPLTLSYQFVRNKKYAAAALTDHGGIA